MNLSHNDGEGSCAEYIIVESMTSATLLWWW